MANLAITVSTMILVTYHFLGVVSNTNVIHNILFISLARFGFYTFTKSNFFTEIRIWSGPANRIFNPDLVRSGPVRNL